MAAQGQSTFEFKGYSMKVRAPYKLFFWNWSEIIFIQKKERFSESRISGLDLTEEKNMPCVQGPRYVGDHSNQLTKISEQNF